MKLLSNIFLILIIISACQSLQNKKDEQANSLKAEAVKILRDILKEQQEWIKVHAAEFLIWTGNTRGVKDVFVKELDFFGDQPQYRIGIWRVLTQLSCGDEAEGYKKQIVNVFLDTTSRDRIHAIETMAKLRLSPFPQYPQATDAAFNSDIKSLSAYAHWATGYTNEDSLKAAKKHLLNKLLDANEDIVLRRIAAYILRNSGTLEVKDWNVLSGMVLSLPEDAEGKINFLNAALLTAPPSVKGSESYQKIFNQFLSSRNKKDKSTRMEVAAGLAVIGTDEHLPLLAQWMYNTDPIGNVADNADIQASATYAILQIIKSFHEIDCDVLYDLQL